MKKLFLLLALLCCGSSIRAGVLVNEALVNEPGSDVTLEWIELYNDSSQSVDLTFFVLNINGTSLSLNGQGFLESGQYMIICRNLVASGASPGFETIWGNNSGLWGDTPEEAALKIAEESFSLLNATGYIELSRVSTVVSRLEWSGTGADGYSWERISRNNNVAINSIDPTGSTPGRANSVSPVALDLAIDTVIADPTDIGCDLTFEIVNLGTDSAKTQSLLLYRAVHPDTLAITDTILNFAIPPLAPGRRDTLVFSLTENSIYAYVGAMVSTDGRLTNNRGFAWITGTLFPGMIISEFLPDPQSPLQTEWVELRNISGGSVNLANWRFGDELNLRLISSTTFNIAV
ncbi:MAG: lamin tail domain-containing protein, partial [candidate division Zixibacteria bacterium]|nr:lamin tail domain-containing protein [candidate division Zixibacteria bacterium]